MSFLWAQLGFGVRKQNTKSRFTASHFAPPFSSLIPTCFALVESRSCSISILNSRTLLISISRRSLGASLGSPCTHLSFRNKEKSARHDLSEHPSSDFAYVEKDDLPSERFEVSEPQLFPLSLPIQNVTAASSAFRALRRYCDG